MDGVQRDLTGKPAAAKSARDGKKVKKDSDAQLENTKENLSALLAPVNVEMERETSPRTSVERPAEGGGSARNCESPPPSRKRAADKSPQKDSPTTN